MNEITGEQVNSCFEMACGKDTEHAGIYDDVVEQKKAVERIQKDEKTKQTSSEPCANSNKQSNSVMSSRSLCFMVAGLVVCFLTAAAAFVLALIIMARISLITSTEAVTSRDDSASLCSSCQQGSRDNKVQDFTERLESMQRQLENMWMVINSTEGQISNLPRKDQHIEDLMNATRQQTKRDTMALLTAFNASQDSLSQKIRKVQVDLHQRDQKVKSIRELTMKEIRWVWTVVNASQVSLSEKLQKIQDNFTQQLNRTIVLLQNSDDSLFASLVEVNSTITLKVNNISEGTVPIGPRGFNGSRGAPGPAGSAGPPGPKGSGDFSTCQYKTSKTVESPGLDDVTTFLDEPNGKRVLGVACSANFGAENNLLSTVRNNVRRYICYCRKTSPHYGPPSGERRACFLHYWECPLTT
ncbi:uncharacterized protein [Montipora foliosa]|uniref:uncharacterized protein n=1 Tax=Montipora foliosa TaxID=591990 RepID=UPI0035F1D20D